MIFFVDQPEVFNTINMVQGYLYKDFPVLWIIGGLFIFIVLLLAILQKRLRAIKKNYVNIIIFTILIFWTPLFLNSFYNSIYDIKEDIILLKSDMVSKRIIRYCSADYHQELFGEFCALIPFIKVIKETIPEDSLVKINAKPGMSPYFYYYDLYSLYNFTHNPFEAEYIIVHFSPDYYWQDNTLYQIKHPSNKLTEDRIIGSYVVINKIGTYSAILKKL